MRQPVKIGTRDSQLATWQATHVQTLLKERHIDSTLVFIKSDGDMDTVTPLYEIGVRGIFTKTLDSALLAKQIDLAVHSMKDVPTQLATGIMQAAVLKRASFKDLLIFRDNLNFMQNVDGKAIIATSSIRRKAQWLNRYPNHSIENLRGNINTRLKKLNDGKWNGAIFAAAGVERISLRPANSLELDWMLPAPAQGAIMLVCREGDKMVSEICAETNDITTAECTKAERDFLRALNGGCSTPISALAEKISGKLFFRGNVCSPDGKQLVEIERVFDANDTNAGNQAAEEILQNSIVRDIIYQIQNEPQ